MMFDIQKANELKGEGVPIRRIAAMLGTTEHKLRVAIEPGFAAKRAKSRRIRQAQDAWAGKEAAKARKAAGITFTTSEANRRAEQDWQDRLKELGPDDRGLTAKIMGDPPSWRSALGRPAR